MPILSQILGTSFGRGPATIAGVPVHPVQPPPMYAAPQRPQLQEDSQHGKPMKPNGADMSVPDALLNRRFPNGFMGGRGTLHGVPPTPTTPPVVGAAAPSGVMGSIMQAFNNGAGGGMDMSKLLSMLPMIAG